MEPGDSSNTKIAVDETNPASAVKWLKSVDLNLIPYKLLFFFSYAGGQGAFLTYLPLYLKQMGLTAGQTGFVIGTNYIVQACSPIWGVISDRYKRPKLIITVGLLIWTAKGLLVMSVQPHGQTCRLTAGNKTSLQLSTHERQVLFTQNSSAIVKSAVLKPLRADLQPKEKEDKRGDYTLTTIYRVKQPSAKKRRRSDQKTSPSPELELESTAKSENVHNLLIRVGVAETLHSDNVYLPKMGKSHKTMERDELSFSKVKESKDLIIENKTLHYTWEVNREELDNIFAIILVLMIIFEMFGGSVVLSLEDAVTIEFLGEEGVQRFGQIRMYSYVGKGVAIFSVGAIANQFQYTYCGKAFKNYFVLFYFFIGTQVFSVICNLLLKVKTSEKVIVDYGNQLKAILSVLGNVRNAAFLSVGVFQGLNYGFVAYFTLWYLENLGASPSVLGLAGGLYYSIEALFFFLSKYVLELCGYALADILSMILFTTAMLTLSYVRTVWQGVTAFVLTGGGFALCYTTTVAYVGAVSHPKRVVYSMQGILHALVHAAGAGGGTIAAGALVERIGIRNTYRVFSAVSAIVLVLFVVVIMVNKCLNARQEKVAYHSITDRDLASDE